MSPAGPEESGTTRGGAPLHVDHHPVPVITLWDVDVVMPVAPKSGKKSNSRFFRGIISLHLKGSHSVLQTKSQSCTIF